MKNHPIADVWPMMDDDKLKELADDISRNGQVSPVWLYEGKILDGRNRWAACKIAGVEPTTKEYTGTEPTAFAVAMNDRRRHMNKGALAAVAVELLPFFEADAKKRQKAAGKDHGRGQKVVEKIPQPIENQPKASGSREPQVNDSSVAPKAREEAAKSVGVNDRYVQDAKKVKEEAPEVFEQLKAGKITLQNAKREVSKKPTDDWRQDERDRQAEVEEEGMTVVANASSDKNLIAWAEKKGIAVRIDRGTRFGNPFVLGEDGDRDDVCEAYADYYLPHKKGILASIESGQLEGKVLICHCYPKRCHGDCLAEAANCIPVR